LIQAVGSIVATEPTAGGVRLTVEGPCRGAELDPGESIAVDGTCLTVADRTESGFVADVIEETLRCTTLGRLKPGDRVNLERALAVGDRLGGHIVQGHVDATAPVVHVHDDGSEYRLRIGLSEVTSRFVAFKGSVALQGVSLTVASVDDEAFEVALIPTTLQETNLAELSAGDHVNVEVDLFARYLERMLHVTGGEARPA
jgi:riboflavin synthase